MWEDPDEAEDIELLNSDKYSLPVEEASQPSVVADSLPALEGINPALPEETVMASPEVVAMQKNSESPQDPLHHQSLLLVL